MPLILNGSTGISATDGSSLIGANQIGTSQLQDNAVTTPKIAADAVVTADIANGAVTTAKIADANVTTAKIADGNVTTAKIADGNVTIAKLSATGTPNSSTFLRGDNSWQTVSGGVTSVATGNGLQGGTITSSGTLSLACPGGNTVGSWVLGDVVGNNISLTYGSSTFGIGGGLNQMKVVWTGGDFAYNSTPISGTWRYFGCSISNPGGAYNAGMALYCRLS